MTSSYIVAARRTPIGKLMGGLAAKTAPELAAAAIRAALDSCAIEHERVDEVIMGNVLSAGVGQAPARQAALLAGLPPSVAALTVNKVCGSGLKAVMLADQAVRAGDARVIVAGGMENMSRAPYLLADARKGWKFGDQTAIDSMIRDGLWCANEQVGMGELAEQTAEESTVSRADQDAFAAESHRRAAAAMDDGRFATEVIPVTFSGKSGLVAVDQDEGPRRDTSEESLAAIKPAFRSNGTVTAGNSSQISDGAAAVVVVSESDARELPIAMRFRIVAAATSGVAPKDLFIAPISAIEKVLERADLTLSDIDLVELNEAFAAQCLACMRPLNLDPSIVNVNGGAIALGHPIGASGSRVLVTLLHALNERGLERGLAALCLGGGNAVAMIVERVA